MTEKQVASSAFWFGIIFYAIKMRYKNYLYQDILFYSAFGLIVLSALFVTIYIKQWKNFFNFFVGGLAFFTLITGILLAAYYTLNDSSEVLIEGLIRLIIALLFIWKIQADIRGMKLSIVYRKKKHGWLYNLLYGILFPPRETYRIIKIMIFIGISYYFIISGLFYISQINHNIPFLNKTEQISLNLLFVGIQTPAMMASRANISKAFSNYLQNSEWFSDMNQSTPIFREMDIEDLSYSDIRADGKHMWLTVLLILILQAFQPDIRVLL